MKLFHSFISIHALYFSLSLSHVYLFFNSALMFFSSLCLFYLFFFCYLKLRALKNMFSIALLRLLRILFIDLTSNHFILSIFRCCLLLICCFHFFFMFHCIKPETHFPFPTPPHHIQQMSGMQIFLIITQKNVCHGTMCAFSKLINVCTKMSISLFLWTEKKNTTTTTNIFRLCFVTNANRQLHLNGFNAKSSSLWFTLPHFSHNKLKVVHFSSAFNSC